MAQIMPLADPTLISLPTTHSSSSSSPLLRLSDSHNSSKQGLCHDAMRRRLRPNLFLTFAAIAFFLLLSLHLSRHAFSSQTTATDFLFSSSAAANLRSGNSDHYYNLAIHEDSDLLNNRHVRHVSSVKDSNSTAAASVSVLLTDWEVLVIVSHPVQPLSGDDFVCLFQNGDTSEARYSGVLPMNNRTTYKCTMPNSVRSLRPFFMPVLTKPSTEKEESPPPFQLLELYRWTFLVYESFSTEDDIVLFVKGVNNRQGRNRPPSDLNCVFFYDDGNNYNIATKTAVTSSAQEVFRCAPPELTSLDFNRPIKVSLEILYENMIVPSVAQYIRRCSLANPEPKSLLCAFAMVYNSGKFLKEWVTYYSKIGVDKFILYDNDSNDNLSSVVEELNGKGYNVTTLFWVWPKAQEAGFSHSAIYGKDSCSWMMYVDVDEFIYSPSWTSSSKPSDDMLKSLLPRAPPSKPSDGSINIGQVSIKCNDFGPSNQPTHPTAGVTQGYTCRRKAEERHKSILLLEAVDPSLLNVIHHFHLISDKYRSNTISMQRAVVNHYKYQAWSEFRNKFRRRVSTYVADWTEKVNPESKDRTPGLGFEAVEPKGWAKMFCEVRDERLKLLTRKWFGSRTSDGYKMAWENDDRDEE
ncbi:hypothetical protein L484_024858 [Morus notabilis]|uniref:Glycosyltransferase family 92 protein n=1 Tax=Morus notabilis TaxID=981085 RepID=W9R4N9_9ROSA|nr:glycosyltransferase family 92 protein RCOM_0530710 [Morus notabilis]EXB56316.1 hypothetical protein L484_024858 [Morus notabilis]